MDGNTYRAIAEVLFGAKSISPNAPGKPTTCAIEPFASCKRGFALMRGGYRELLRPEPPKRIAKRRQGVSKIDPPSFGIPLRSACSAIVTARRAAIRGGAPDDHGASQMPDPNAGLPPRYLRTPEAARFLSLSGRTLEKHRTYGTGPAYRKIGGRVVYALDDLKAWADRGTKTSTSDPGNGTVLPAKRHAALRPYAGQVASLIASGEQVSMRRKTSIRA